MSKRSTWLFEFGIAELILAAGARRAHHQDRLQHWTAQHEDAKAKLKTEGIDFHESVTVNTNTTRYNDQPTFDPILLQAQRDAQTKVNHHEEMVDTFERYARAFQHMQQRDGAAVLELDIDDMLLFGL